MNDIIQWIIVGFAVLGLAFNSGILYNDVRHLKKSVNDLWGEINEIKKILIERGKK